VLRSVPIFQIYHAAIPGLALQTATVIETVDNQLLLDAVSASAVLKDLHPPIRPTTGMKLC